MGLGSLFGGGGSNKTSSSVTIPSWLKKDVRPLYKESARLGMEISKQPYQRYGGQRVADINSGMRSAISGIQGNVNNPLLGQAKGYASDVSSGKYLNNNPYLQGVVDISKRGVTDSYNKTMRPQMEANMARQNAFGGSGWMEANRDINEQLSQSLADAEMGLRYQDYGTERGYQDRSAQLLQSLAGQDLANQQAALSASDLERQQQQAQIDANYGDFTEERDWLFRALQGLQGGLGNVSGIYGQSGTSGSSGGNVLGNAMGAFGSLGQGYAAFKGAK
jgi:hypothetical protein